MKDIKERIKKVVEQCKKDGTYVDPETGKTCIKAASKIKYFIEEFVGEIGIETNIKLMKNFMLVLQNYITSRWCISYRSCKSI